MKELLDKLNQQAEKVLREIYSISGPEQGEKGIPAFLRFLFLNVLDEDGELLRSNHFDKEEGQCFLELYLRLPNRLWEAVKSLVKSGDLENFPESKDKEKLKDWAGSLIAELVNEVPTDLRPIQLGVVHDD